MIIAIVGMRFIDFDAAAFEAAIDYKLEAEPDNTYDPSAVKALFTVDGANWVHFGYVARSDNHGALVPLMRHPYKLTIDGRGNGAIYMRCRLPPTTAVGC
jgi:hypothetical protein